MLVVYKSLLAASAAAVPSLAVTEAQCDSARPYTALTHLSPSNTLLSASPADAAEYYDPRDL